MLKSGKEIMRRDFPGSPMVKTPSFQKKKKRLLASTIGGTGKIPGQATKVTHAMCHRVKKKKKKNMQKSSQRYL